MRGSIFRLRGFAAADCSCPSCGGETMTASPPRVLRPLLSLFNLRYRWCRRCLRQWIGRSGAAARLV